jgi:cyclopropane fatty-acyl-phospholipid synthase-like methyltransferase
MSSKPFSESAESNKDSILKVISKIFTDETCVLEIGSGTGQHAVYFTEQLPHLTWQPTELEDKIEGIKMWLETATHNRILEPRVMNVTETPQEFKKYQYIFTANTAHFISKAKVEAMFRIVGKLLKPGGFFVQYGPFNYQGRFTSESNEKFDQWLKAEDPNRGIRNFEDLSSLSAENEMQIFKDYEMPANNRILVWQKI